jgi:hypothetical protein
MNNDTPCHCSIEALQMMSELQNVPAVVEVETVLDLIHRACGHGRNIIQCQFCATTPQMSVTTLPALSEQCLPLFEALCSAYDISTQPGFFDSAMLAFDQTPSSFICIRSKVILGETELDENETRLLVQTLLSRSLMSLVESMEGFKGVLSAMLENSYTHQNTIASIRACEISMESIISRLAVLMQSIEGECDTAPLP